MRRSNQLVHDLISLQAVLKRLPSRSAVVVDAARGAFARHVLNAERGVPGQFSDVDDAWCDFQRFIEIGEHALSRIKADPLATFEVVMPQYIPLPDVALSVVANATAAGVIQVVYEDSMADNMQSIEDRLMSASMRTWDGSAGRRRYVARRADVTTIGYFDFVLKALTLERADLLMKVVVARRANLEREDVEANEDN